jgi:hypothetical protein
LIILVPMVDRDEQIRLFGLALGCVEALADTFNRLIEIFSDGEIRVHDWSASETDAGYIYTHGKTP